MLCIVFGRGTGGVFGLLGSGWLGGRAGFLRYQRWSGCLYVLGFYVRLAVEVISCNVVRVNEQVAVERQPNLFGRAKTWGNTIDESRVCGVNAQVAVDLRGCEARNDVYQERFSYTNKKIPIDSSISLYVQRTTRLWRDGVAS